jgi:hypothetical protein
MLFMAGKRSFPFSGLGQQFMRVLLLRQISRTENCLLFGGCVGNRVGESFSFMSPEKARWPRFEREVLGSGAMKWYIDMLGVRLGGTLTVGLLGGKNAKTITPQNTVSRCLFYPRKQRKR